MKIAVYSAVFGGYDNVRDPMRVEKGVDYFLFTDAPQIRTRVWQPIKGKKVSSDPRRRARYYKTNPQVYFSHYDYWIWHDANIIIGGSMVELCKHVKDNHLFCLSHPGGWNCLYYEAKVCSRNKLDKPQIIAKQMAAYAAEGYPKRNGLADTSFMVRRNTPEVVALNEMWWGQISKYSRRDQLSFNYCLWKTGAKFSYFAKGHHPNKWFCYGKHRTKDRRRFT